jgi:hypothetical protein
MVCSISNNCHVGRPWSVDHIYYDKGREKNGGIYGCVLRKEGAYKRYYLLYSVLFENGVTFHPCAWFCLSREIKVLEFLFEVVVTTK